MNKKNVIVSVGSNIDPFHNIAICLELLQSEVRVTGSSSFYVTKPVGNPDTADFVNGAFGFRT
ncbi:MAG: 2-amino-4-hydroxy-6-hydroxymethyldihydropteridine diphosphokinase, partial [Spirochaetaceae bacterium]